MFVFTFTIGKFIEKLEIEKNNKICMEDNKDINNSIGKEDNTSTEIDSNITDVYIKGEDIENIIDDVKENNNTISETYTVVDQTSYIENLHTFKVGFITFSYIFLTFFLISTFFFIKYQLKLNKKASK